MNVARETTLTRTQPSTMVVTLIVILAALIPRLLTYDRYLPVIDYNDEVTYVALAHEMRGMSDQTALREKYGALAPLYVGLNYLVQSVQYPLRSHEWELPAEYFYTLRLIAVGLGVGTALCIAWAGWTLAGSWAALLGGLLWGLSPLVVEFNSLAIPDPPLYFTCALALAAGLQAIRSSGLRWLILSMLAGIAAIYIKLWIASAMLPFLIASIYLVRQNRQKYLRPVIILFGIGALFAAHFLLVLNPFANTNKMDTAFSDGVISHMLSPARLLNNLWHTFYAIDLGLHLSYLVIIAGLVAWWYAGRRSIQRLPGWLLSSTLIYFLVTWWLSAGVSFVNLGYVGRMRHVFPVVVGAMILWASFLIQLYLVLADLLKERTGWFGQVSRGVVVIVPLVLIPGALIGNLRMIDQFSRPHISTLALNWFDSSPPRDGIVLVLEEYWYDRLWNRLWGAYTGSKPYEWWWTKLEDLTTSTPSEYLERNIRWLVLGEDFIQGSRNPEALQAYLDQLLLVKTIPADKFDFPVSRPQEDFHAYRFEQPDYLAGFDYGSTLRLMAYDLSSNRLTSGETLSFRPYWQLKQATPHNYSMFLHLYRQESVDAGEPIILAQFDGEPLHNSNRPTSTWNDLSEIYLAEPLQFGIPADLTPGAYVLAVGLYDYQTGERLLGVDDTSFYAIPLNITGEN